MVRRKANLRSSRLPEREPKRWGQVAQKRGFGYPEVSVGLNPRRGPSLRDSVVPKEFHTYAKGVPRIRNPGHTRLGIALRQSRTAMPVCSHSTQLFTGVPPEFWTHAASVLRALRQSRTSDGSLSACASPLGLTFSSSASSTAPGVVHGLRRVRHPRTAGCASMGRPA